MKAMSAWMNYSPYPFYDCAFGAFHGKGNLTMEFFVNDLKPYIDAHFRRRQNASIRGLAGRVAAG